MNVFILIIHAFGENKKQKQIKKPKFKQFSKF